MPDKEPDKYLEAARERLRQSVYFNNNVYVDCDNNLLNLLAQFARQSVERAVAKERKEIAVRLRTLEAENKDGNAFFGEVIEDFITELETSDPDAD